ncbi:MAG: hypothetical protein ACI8WA_001215, partial [Polaribacter sp.]
ASRLVLHKSLDASQLGLEELIDEVIKNSFKKEYKNTYYQELQNVVNVQVLDQLFYLAAAQNNYKQVTAIVNSKLNEISSWLRSRKSKGLQLMYDKELDRSISAFKKDPSKFKKVQSPKIPDGSPIGME